MKEIIIKIAYEGLSEGLTVETIETRMSQSSGKWKEYSIQEEHHISRPLTSIN